MLLLAEAPIWNSLEIVRLAIDILSPAILLVFGFWVNRTLQGLEQQQWANQKVTEKRVAIFEEIAPLLNDVYCYFSCIGGWKEMKPTEVVALKRDLDKVAYVNAPLFPPEFLHKYNALINKYYLMNTGWGEDAKLRLDPAHHKKAAGPTWKRDWNEFFAPEDDVTNISEIRGAYGEFTRYLSTSLGIGIDGNVKS